MQGNDRAQLQTREARKDRAEEKSSFNIRRVAASQTYMGNSEEANLKQAQNQKERHWKIDKTDKIEKIDKIG